MKKTFLLMILTVLLVGCPITQPTPPPEFISVPTLPAIMVGNQATLDLSGYVTGGAGQLVWSVSNANTNMISANLVGNLLIVTAKFQTGNTSFTLTATDNRGLSDSVQVSVGIIDGAEGEGEGESEGEGEGEGELQYFNLTVSPPINGTVSLYPVSGRYLASTIVSLTATAQMGWHFDHWTGNVANALGSSTTITIYRHETVSVVFDQDEAPVACKIHGLDFSPFVEEGQNPDWGSTASQAQVNRLVDIIAPRIEWLRTYGSLSGNEFAPPRAKYHGLKVAIGIWIGSDLAANDREIAAAIAIANAGNADMIIVGTEVLLRGDISESQLIAYIEYVWTRVSVPVATAEIPSVLLAHPDVMDACDVLLIDVYPFWEGVAIGEAVKSLDSSYNDVVAAAGGKQVIIAETGWPTDGNTIGQAVPSLDNAAFYFLNFISWAKAKEVDYWYFEAFDEPWKPAKVKPKMLTRAKSIGTSWGLFTSAGVLKSGMQAVFDCETMEDNWSDPMSNCAEGSPLLDLTAVPPIGSNDLLKGQVCGVNPADYGVAVYIFVGGWWNKPYWEQKLTSLSSDGSWDCAIFTGGNDGSATQIAAFLVPRTYDPPTLGGEQSIPQSIYADAADYVIMPR